MRLSSLTYQYDNSDNITGITDTLDASKSRSIGYDPVERLTRMNGAVNGFAREDYLHDDNGNRLVVERRATVGAATPAESDLYSIAPGTNRLTSITTPAGTRSFTHDARGNLTGETRPEGSTVTMTYDGRARLTSYSVGAATQTMLYNGADERIRVVTTPASGPTDTRQFVYDLDHRIVGEYGAGGAADLKAGYIWLLPEVGASGPTGGDDGTGGYTPLAVAVGVAGTSGITSEVQWVHASHLGTPILTTNASGQAVTPYGYAAIGFPGQFANALLLPGAEHYYNRYRDYDPTTGRYIQADPIGLAGGPSPYAYASGNPLKYSDSDGLVPGLVIGGGARLIGGAAPAGRIGGAVRAALGAGAGGVVACVLVFDCGSPVPKVERPQGMSPAEESLFDRICKKADDPCPPLRAAADAEIASIRTKMLDMRRDKLGLFGNEGWLNHGNNLRGRIQKVRDLISLGKKLRCDMSRQEAALKGLYIPTWPDLKPL